MKKEGRLLTKKQKEERTAAEIRRKALLESGVKIEGLQQQQNGQAAGGAPKKVVYGSRKKKGPAQAKEEAVPERGEPKSEVVSSPVVESLVVTPVQEEAADDWEASDTEEKKVLDDVKDSWDASSDEEAGKKVSDGVKDSWDASSDEEKASQPPKPLIPTKVTKPATKLPAPSSKGNTSTQTVAAKTPTPVPTAPIKGMSSFSFAFTNFSSRNSQQERR